ncbi:FAD assembly factor SdhE [Thioalkalivibrio thiocyanodenitrificans]|uniref:FAD assembly factor SdhE n=1 Tax=Thioalkalivibrio thiocyanodenitrificans TaxID=243063 RepID=UPI0003725D75|nr:succinate dehydrogenase assembly factor 2 [Thioalkalivibrio thiocyanodenitrificans]
MAAADSANTEEVARRLRWSCRRGMLELDLLLEGFLRHGIAGLDVRGQEAFERLLAYPDTTLLQLLLGQMQSSDREVAHVVELIRDSTRRSS